MRDLTLAFGTFGAIMMKSTTNSEWLCEMTARFEYWPSAMFSGSSILSCPGAIFLSDMDDLNYCDEPGSIKKSGNIYIFAGSAKSWNVFQWAMVSPAFKPILVVGKRDESVGVTLSLMSST